MKNGYPETAAELFNEALPVAIAKDPEKVRYDIGAVYLFKIKGSEGGTWTVDCADNTPKVTAGDGGRAQCTFEIDVIDFHNLLSNPALTMQLYFQGKLRVMGDPMLATKLQKLFRLIG